ncbi:MAG: hypothetical protein CTY15_11010 [Methylocystis sp.]|nr:MAG: hypothetical protein CTY15_11010 [Methylocystis sp.]
MVARPSQVGLFQRVPVSGKGSERGTDDGRALARLLPDGATASLDGRWTKRLIAWPFASRGTEAGAASIRLGLALCSFLETYVTGRRLIDEPRHVGETPP